MNQIAHDIRRTNWRNIISQCQERPAGVSAKQWLSDNGIREKSYYYWLGAWFDVYDPKVDGSIS
jgi:hypothetical protein